MLIGFSSFFEYILYFIALVKVFDLLYLNGQSLIHRSLTFRKRNLKHCLKEIKGHIEYVIEYKGKTVKDIRERMDQVMVARGEGLIIKHPLSKYVLNGRNMDWVKVRPCSYACVREREVILILFFTLGEAGVYGI